MDLPESVFTVYWILFASWSGQLSYADSEYMDIDICVHGY